MSWLPDIDPMDDYKKMFFILICAGMALGGGAVLLFIWAWPYLKAYIHAATA